MSFDMFRCFQYLSSERLEKIKSVRHYRRMEKHKYLTILSIRFYLVKFRNSRTTAYDAQKTDGLKTRVFQLNSSCTVYIIVIYRVY